MAGPTDFKIATASPQTKPKLRKSEASSRIFDHGVQESAIGLTMSHEWSKWMGVLLKASELLLGKLGDEPKRTRTDLINPGSRLNVCVPVSREIVADPGEWVRPLGCLEMFMSVGGDYGTLNTVQGVWLSSTRPILPEEVRQALTIVARQTQVLQLCVEWRGLWPWFRRMKVLLVPFKVDHGDVMSVYCKIQSLPYQMSRGPLWRARLVPLPPRSPGRYEAVLVIAAHHCITDGLTNMQVCRETLQILNAIMSGRQHKVLPRLVIPSLAEEQLTLLDWLCAFKYFCRKIYGSLFTNYNTKLYFNGALQQPATRLAITKVLHKEYTVETTRLLLLRCKEARVTVHSCIVAAVNLALLSVAQKNSTNQLEEALINGVNCINMRRYYPQEYKESPGCHISLEEQERLIRSSDASSKENFWCLANRLNGDLRKSLNVDKIPIKNYPLYRLSTLILHINYLLTSLGRKHRTDSHFVTTNMGDLRDLLPGKYDGPVEITNLLRSVSSELTGNPFTVVFHTFLERFMISLDYYTTKVTDEVAELFFSTLTNYITNIAHHGTVLVTTGQ
ncbi:uncharacterized protein [Procambarus clarkii]|uniref:uncharacterized protein n=1 Tax=Procambarus clarkii TaxID=6728 RepID=UPI001E6734C1|nr:uncharacterized protein LOC123759129 [Procambarus clarkii]